MMIQFLEFRSAAWSFRLGERQPANLNISTAYLGSPRWSHGASIFVIGNSMRT
jgi:hypothetical protein